MSWVEFTSTSVQLCCAQLLLFFIFLDTAAPSAPHLLHFFFGGACGAAIFSVAAPAAPPFFLLRRLRRLKIPQFFRPRENLVNSRGGGFISFFLTSKVGFFFGFLRVKPRFVRRLRRQFCHLRRLRWAFPFFSDVFCAVRFRVPGAF